MVGMQIASRLSNLIDHRKRMATGLLILGFTLHAMSCWTPDVSQHTLMLNVSQHTLMLTLMSQRLAIGFVFNPLTVMAFTTLQSALCGYATSPQAAI